MTVYHTDGTDATVMLIDHSAVLPCPGDWRNGQWVILPYPLVGLERMGGWLYLLLTLASDQLDAKELCAQ